MEAFPDLEEYLRYTSSLVGNPTAIELKAVEVRLSDEHFLESLKKMKGKTGNEGVEQLEVWPSSKTMAELALAVYEDDGGLSSALLQAGWEVLTTASSPYSLDGYFGAAYLNRDQQQLVLAHRGTKNLSSWNTNIKSIVNNAITSRMNSAITFSGNIIAALKECEDSSDAGIRFQLSMTGHSLGGWLAQVATFFSEYLEWNEEGITELKTGRGGYHVRTVAFESPGCELMLNKLVKDLDLRYKVTMDLGRLDITSFLTAPNMVNTMNVHAGEVFKIDIDLTTMTFFHKYTFQYTMFTHSMEKIAEAFRENKKVSRVLDWPRAGVLHTRAEYEAFHSRATRGNEYNPPTAARPSWDHYSTEEVSDDSCSLRVFSDRELALLEVFVALEKSKLDLVKIDNFLGKIGLEVSINKLFGDTTYNYKEGTLKCPSLDQVVKFVKILLRWWGDEAEKAAQEQMKLVPSAGEAMWLQESRRVLDSFPKLLLGLEDVIGLKPFLEAPDRKVLVLEAADTAFEFYRVHCLLQQMDSQESQLFLEWKQFEDLQKYTDFEVLTTSEAADNRILVLNYNKQTAEVNKLLEELLASYGVTKSARKKLILVSKGESDLKFSDLTTEARESIVTRTFILVKDKPTTPTSIRDMLGSGGVSEEAINDLLDGPTLRELVMNDELKVHLDGYWPDFQAMDASHTTVNTEINMGELKGFLRKQSRPYLVVSGLSQDDRQSSEWSEIFKLMAEDVNDTEQEEEAGAALFRQACQNQENKTVVWVQLAVGKLWLKRVYDLNLYVKRTFVNKIEIDFKELVKLDFTKLDPIYVFQNIENGNTMKDSIKDLSNDLAKRCVFLGSGEQYNEPAHFLEIEEVGTEKQRVVWKSSTMSLDGLRPAASYSTASQDDIGEQQLSAVLMQRKLVLLVGEPGMGKSTLLTAVPRYILNSWLVRIDLRHYQAKIRNLTPHLNYQDVVKFLLPEQSESFQLKLFQYVLKSEASYRACILFDGFDEIQEEYSGQVIEKSAMGKTVALLKFLMHETSANVVVTTRSYPRELLENELSTFATRFKQIDQEQQRQFSQEFWRLRLAGGVEEGLLRRCSEALCNLGGTFAGFMGVPLQMRMLTEGFLPLVRRLGASPPTDPEQSLADVFRCGSTHGLYELFIQSKIDIYLREKLNLSPIPLMKWIENGISEKHQKLGFIQLFPNLRFQQKELIELSKVGLFQLGADWTCDFIHPTFAEYFAAAYFEGGSLLKAEVELLMTVVLLEERFKVVRMFLNGHLRKHRENWTNEPEKRIFSDIKELWSEKRVRHKFFTKNKYQTALHVAVKEQNESIVRFLLMVLQSENTSKEGRGISEFVDFVASRDMDDKTALHLACDNKDAVCVGVFIADLEACALQDKRYVLYSFMYGYTGNMINVDDYLELLDRLEVQVPAYFQEIISNKDEKWQAVNDFLEAAKSGKDKYIEQSLRNIKDEVVKRSLLRALNHKGHSGLHLAAKGGCLPTVRVLLQHGAPPDILNTWGETPLICIANNGNPKSQIKIAEELIKSGAYPDYRDTLGMSAVSHCAKHGNLALLNYLIDECKADWKMPDFQRQSPLHHAARLDHPQVVERLLELGAPIDEQDESESTALVLVIKEQLSMFYIPQLFFQQSCGLRVIELLVAKGANVNIRDSQGNSPLRLAIQNAVENERHCASTRTKPASFSRDIVHILKKNGAEY